jgi:hypothetical protein
VNSNQPKTRQSPFNGPFELLGGIQLYVLAFPFILPLALYLTWLAGRFTLGYWPRPSLDDPKFIGSWVSILHTLTTLLLMGGFPVFAVIIPALLCRALLDQPHRNRLLLVSGCSSVCMMGAIMFLRWDPLGVAEWFMD